MAAPSWRDAVPMLSYTVIGNNGDEAEATGYSAARLAAQTLLAEGSDSVEIWSHRWVASASVEDGRFTIRTTQGQVK
jgi:hypothetical protein